MYALKLYRIKNRNNEQNAVGMTNIEHVCMFVIPTTVVHQLL